MKRGIIPSIKIKTGKNMIRALLLGGAALLLSACGGGDGGSPAQTSAPTSSKSVLIEAYGDSTTVGCTATPGATSEICPTAGYAMAATTEPQALQSLLRASLGSSVTVSNKGIAGITADNLLNGTGREGGQTWQTSMAVSKAQIVTINIGLNDAWKPNENFVADLQNIVSTARQYGKTIILYTPNPALTPNSSVNANLLTYREQILQTAASMNVTVVDDYSITSLEQWAQVLPDGMHPTAQGYEMKAQAEAYVLTPIVKALM
ncbi:SGNH/GDSL hydrolase family protein [Burkholderia pseudomallei]|uniref:SGNH/GDSL hydrolase family protein n=1 Tax=Burkholderia pseudomallei TaxID=28450 RepID=UPI000A1CB7B5|nr:SGNH/GDSL hydrolase family protein [Burkholderia pseudomallei]